MDFGAEVFDRGTEEARDGGSHRGRDGAVARREGEELEAHAGHRGTGVIG